MRSLRTLPIFRSSGPIRAAIGARAATRGSSNRLISASHLSDQLFGIRVGTPACLASVYVWIRMSSMIASSRPQLSAASPYAVISGTAYGGGLDRSASTGSRSSLTWRSPAGRPWEFSPDDRAGHAASERATPHLPIPASETKSLRPQGRAGRGLLPLDQRNARAAHPRWPAPLEGSLPPLPKRWARALMFEGSAAA